MNIENQRDDNFVDSKNMSISKDISCDEVESQYKSLVLSSLNLQLYSQSGVYEEN